MTDNPKIHLNYQEALEQASKIARELEQRQETTRQREVEENRRDRINSIWTVDELIDAAKEFNAQITRDGKRIVIVVEDRE